MSGARERILARAREGADKAPRGGVDPRRWPEAALRHPRPALERQLAQRFVAKAQASGASLVVVESWAKVGEAVAIYLHGHGRPLRLARAPDPTLDAISWPEGASIERPARRGRIEVALCAALAAVAETGTLVLSSGPASPTLLNFLSEVHIVVVPGGRLVPRMEDVWPLLRKRGMPRALNFVTGPSRSADVEQTMQTGAHGPRAVHVIVVAGQAAARP